MKTKNLVFLTALGPHRRIRYARYSLLTWRWWCRRHGVRLHVMRRKPLDVEGMRPTWMRYAMFDVLDRAGIQWERAAMVDADTMVRWDCPDFFHQVDTALAAVKDGCRPRWVKRSIRVYGCLFPDTELEADAYFNAGFLVVNPGHRRLFEEMIRLYLENEARMRTLIRRYRRGSDQTPLNFMVKRLGLPLDYLPETFNATHLLPFWRNQRLLIGRADPEAFVRRGHVWHFTGVHRDLVEGIMRRTWERIEDHYA